MSATKADIKKNPLRDNYHKVPERIRSNGLIIANQFVYSTNLFENIYRIICVNNKVVYNNSGKKRYLYAIS